MINEQEFDNWGYADLINAYIYKYTMYSVLDTCILLNSYCFEMSNVI